MVGELMEVMRDPKTIEELKKSLPPETIRTLKQIYNPERDEFMANKIRELYNGKISY